MSSEQNNLLELGRLIGDDGYAMSFQSMGQYRTALLKEVARLSLLGWPATSTPVDEPVEASQGAQ